MQRMKHIEVTVQDGQTRYLSPQVHHIITGMVNCAVTKKVNMKNVPKEMKEESQRGVSPMHITSAFVCFLQPCKYMSAGMR
jgi:hypothetical protein